MNNENGSTANTILIIILVLLVGFGVWFFVRNSNDNTPDDNNVLEVNIPNPDGNETPDSNGQSGNGQNTSPY